MKGENEMKKPKILVVGSINMDLIMYGMSGIPKWGTSTFCTEYQYAAGGKGANQALAAAVQGADTYMVGRIGNDENGKLLLRYLEEAGVHTDYIVVDDEYSTGLSTMNMGERGQYFSIYVAGANMHIRIEDLEYILDQHIFDMVIMQLEMPLEVVYGICELGERKKIPVFIDAGPAMSIPLERLKGTFVISPNEAETEALTGIVPDTQEHIEKAARKIFALANPRYVLLKLGARGAYLYGEKERKVIPGFKVKAIDTTAAGDTFGAAFCVEYCLGEGVEEAIRYAHAAAAVCVTRKGGQISIPSREETEAFYKERGIKHV